MSGGGPAPRVRDVLFLHLLILFHSFIGVVAKTLAGVRFFSPAFIRLYILEILMLVVYAFFWQKLLKRFDLAVAYANNGMYIVWTMAWAALFFGERIYLSNVAGALVVICGIAVLFGRSPEALPPAPLPPGRGQEAAG